MMDASSNTRAMGRAAFVLGAAFCVAVAGPATADPIRCEAVGGAPTVTLVVALPAEGDTPGTVSEVDADLGDFTLSTHPADPDAKAERIESQVSEPGRLEVSLTDPDDIWIVLRLKLVRDTESHRLKGEETDEDWRSVVAGTLSVMGAGVWAVTCEGW